jgi:hypothetical protein
MANQVFRRFSPTTLGFVAIVVLLVLAQTVFAVDVVGTFGEAVATFGLAAVLLVLFSFVALTGFIGEVDGVDARNSRLIQIANGIRALAAGAAIFAIVTRWGQFVELVMGWWFAVPILVGVYVLWVFLNQRTRVASNTTAINRTRGRVANVFTDVSEAVVGAVLLLVTLVLAAVSGALAALSGVGDVFAPIAPELGFWSLTGIGFVQLGGDIPGAALIPSLTPLQWVFMAIVVFGVTLFWSDRR